MTKGPRSRSEFLDRHSLTLATCLVMVAWSVLYCVSNPATHWGSFFGNAIADWTGVVVTLLATKHMYEKGSAESRKPPHPLLRAFPEFLRDHSLTIFLLFTGLGWLLLFRHMDPEARWGQVVGNIVSEWTQIIGLVLLTKRLREIHSKESKR